MKTTLAIAIALTLSACAGPNKAVPPPRDVQFEVGKTTLQEVIKTLGEPNDSTHLPDGGRSIHYFRSETRVNSESTIPALGSFRGSSEVVSSFASMSFSKAGVLTHYSAISGKTLSGTSPASTIASRSDP